MKKERLLAFQKVMGKVIIIFFTKVIGKVISTPSQVMEPTLAVASLLHSNCTEHGFKVPILIPLVDVRHLQAA